MSVGNIEIIGIHGNNKVDEFYQKHGMDRLFLSNSEINLDLMWVCFRARYEGKIASIYLVKRDDEIAGYFPVLKGKSYVHVNFGEKRVYSIPYNSIRIFDVSSVIGDKNALRQIFDRIKRDHIYSCIEANELPITSVVFEHLFNGELKKSGIFSDNKKYNANKHYYIEMPNSYEEYMSSFKSKTRSNRLREYNRIEKAAGKGLNLIKYTQKKQVIDFLQKSELIARRTYQWHLFNEKICCDDNMVKKCSFLANMGWLRSYILCNGDSPISFVFGYQYKNIYIYEQLGHDPEWAKLSPGNVLLHMILQDLFTYNRPTFFDFGGGGGKYKEIHSTYSIDEVNLLLFRKTLKGIILNLVKSSSANANRIAVKVLNKLGIKDKIKSYFRKQ